MTLEWLVGRYHVATPDRVVRAEIAARLRSDLEPKARAALLARAVRIHRANRRLYARVMGGRLGN